MPVRRYTTVVVQLPEEDPGNACSAAVFAILATSAREVVRTLPSVVGVRLSVEQYDEEPEPADPGEEEAIARARERLAESPDGEQPGEPT